MNRDHWQPWMEGQTPSPIAVHDYKGLPSWMIGVAHFAMQYPVGGPGVPQAQANEPGSSIPFTRASTYRAQQQDVTTVAQTTLQQPLEITMQGSGYIYGMDIDVTNVTAANAAAVAYNEDAPWNALSSIVYKDVQGELVNLDGFSLRLA